MSQVDFRSGRDGSISKGMSVKDKQDPEKSASTDLSGGPSISDMYFSSITQVPSQISGEQRQQIFDKLRKDIADNCIVHFLNLFNSSGVLDDFKWKYNAQNQKEYKQTLDILTAILAQIEILNIDIHTGLKYYDKLKGHFPVENSNIQKNAAADFNYLVLKSAAFVGNTVVIGRFIDRILVSNSQRRPIDDCLKSAIHGGDLISVQIFLEKFASGPKVNTAYDLRCTSILECAAKFGGPDILSACQEKLGTVKKNTNPPDIVKDIFDDFQTVLRLGNKEDITTFIENNKDKINTAKTSYFEKNKLPPYFSIMLAAIEGGNADIVAELCEMEYAQGLTPEQMKQVLLQAMKNGNTIIVNTLLQQFRLNLKQENKEDPLFFLLIAAAETGNTDVFKSIYTQCSKQNINSRVLIFCAGVRSGISEFVKHLFSIPAFIEGFNNNNKTAILKAAIEGGSIEVFKLIKPKFMNFNSSKELAHKDVQREIKKADLNNFFKRNMGIWVSGRNDIVDKDGNLISDELNLDFEFFADMVQ